jgi:hypothetical protein
MDYRECYRLRNINLHLAINPETVLSMSRIFTENRIVAKNKYPKDITRVLPCEPLQTSRLPPDFPSRGGPDTERCYCEGILLGYTLTGGMPPTILSTLVPLKSGQRVFEMSGRDLRQPHGSSRVPFSVIYLVPQVVERRREHALCARVLKSFWCSNVSLD